MLPECAVGAVLAAIAGDDLRPIADTWVPNMDVGHSQPKNGHLGNDYVL